MRAVMPTLTLTAVFAALAPAALTAQSAQNVLDRMLAEYDRRAEGIDNYTVIQDVMGQSMSMYFEKDVSGAHPVFRTRQVVVNGMGDQSLADRSQDADEFWAMLPELAAKATSGGRETVDGHAVHVVQLNDMAETGFGKSFAPDNADFTPRRSTLYVDADLWVPRRMVFEGTMTFQGREADITMTIDLRDIRDISGLLHPFVTAVRIDGLGQAVDPEMRQQYEQMKKQLAEMPESQRQMVEQMMKGRMEQMEQVMGGDGGMNVELVVREVRVNAGPPK